MKIPDGVLDSKYRHLNKGSLNGDLPIMFMSWFVISVLGGMAGLVLYDLIQEIMGSSDHLHDRYHE